LYLEGNTSRIQHKHETFNAALVTVSVYCENHAEHTDTVRTSQEIYYVSTTETNRSMLFKETVAVYRENHTEHTDTVRTSQETHYVSATKPNRLVLFGETVAVYCENSEGAISILCVLCLVISGGTCGNLYVFLTYPHSLYTILTLCIDVGHLFTRST
jgi:hypothetical protein